MLGFPQVPPTSQWPSRPPQSVDSQALWIQSRNCLRVWEAARCSRCLVAKVGRRTPLWQIGLTDEKARRFWRLVSPNNFRRALWALGLYSTMRIEMAHFSAWIKTCMFLLGVFKRSVMVVPEISLYATQPYQLYFTTSFWQRSTSFGNFQLLSTTSFGSCKFLLQLLLKVRNIFHIFFQHFNILLTSFELLTTSSKTEKLLSTTFPKI